VGRLLFIDDEPRIVSFVQRALSAAGYLVDSAPDGESGLRSACTGMYDLVILDLRLPSMDGYTVLDRLMDSRPTQPVLVLSAVVEVEHKVRCLRAGACDYLTKPFALPELLARVDAHVRTAGTNGIKQRRVVGDLTLYERRRIVMRGSREVQLSNHEYHLLEYLMNRADDVCTREEMLAEVWGYWFDPGSNVVDVTMRRLRKKVGPELIETVRNVGYRFCAS
jgi:DNA-binding response OmpR family regulator